MKLMQRLFLLLFCLVYAIEGYSQTLVGHITEIKSDEIQIKLSSNVKIGDILEVYQHGGYVTNQKTGRRERKADTLVGTLVVKKVYSEYSIASSNERNILSKLKIGMNVKKKRSTMAVNNTVSEKKFPQNNEVKTKNDYMLDAFVVSSKQKRDFTSNSNNYNTKRNKKATFEKDIQKRIKQLSGKDSRIYIMSHIPDSITGTSVKKELSKRFNSKGYWNTTNNVSEADLILNFYGYEVNDGSALHFYSYALVYDRNFQFLLRTETHRLCSGFKEMTEQFAIKSFCKKIINDIQEANIKKKESDRKKSFSQREFDQCYLNANNSMENYDYKDAKEYYLKCIEMDSEQWQLYKTLGYCCAEMEDYKDALKYFDKYLEYDPTYTELDHAYGIYRGLKIQKSVERSLKIAAIAGVVTTAVAGATSVYAASKGKVTNTTSYNSYSAPQVSAQSSSRVAKETCSYCQGTGISPVATSSPSFAGSGEKYCEHCKQVVSSSHGYHGTCPSCRGKGYIMKIK